MNILIIGASSGIGSALASALKFENTIYCISRTAPEDHPNIIWHKGDISDENFDFSFLPDELNGVVYCPGSINLKPFHQLKKTDFQNDLNINLMGAINTLQAVYPILKKSSNPAVVLFSTVAVTQGIPFHASIATAKGAIEGLVKSLAAEWAPHIRVNAIAPSIIDTALASKILSNEDKKTAAANQHPLKKIGTPEEISQLAAFLLSKNAGWITGQIIAQDGGLSSAKIM